MKEELKINDEKFLNTLVPVICRTNLDDFKRETWPNRMYNPKVGDFVKGNKGVLEIFRITHCYNPSYQHPYYLEIELGKKIL